MKNNWSRTFLKSLKSKSKVVHEKKLKLGRNSFDQKGHCDFQDNS
jgi:hypothetical protein